ncbi:MAG: adenosylcobinamide amidohydrolase [Brevibacillus sp.]|nr:adenosylcobinamide amidohydrolase [Brevibacillus sp.]
MDCLPELRRMPEWNVSLDRERMFLNTRIPFRACSNALWNGGFCQASGILNQRVGMDYGSADPAADIMRAITALGQDPAVTVGLLTAARMEGAAAAYQEGDQFRLCAVVTAGVGNAVRAGRALRTYPAYRAGTINTIVMLDANLTDGAMLNAIVTATEAKTAALQEAGVLDESGLPATGTSTDVVVIASHPTRPDAVTHLYAGTATALGDALAKAVYTATLAAVLKERTGCQEQRGDEG